MAVPDLLFQLVSRFTLHFVPDNIALQIKMQLNMLLSLLAGALASACDIPDGPVLSNNITEGFGIRVQNPEFSVIHNRYLNLDLNGGGDQHLFLSPAGNYSFDLTLKNGVMQWFGNSITVFAVINGEVSFFLPSNALAG